MSSKLTKRQKKAASFRNKSGKGRNEPQDVPLMDDPEADDGFGVTAKPPTEVAPKVAFKKRKREEDMDVDEEKAEVIPKKKAKLATEETNELKSKKPKVPPKYILFVGNLSYKTNIESIATHFSECDPPPTIRQLTSRKTSSTGEVKSEKSKGCAFLEFSKASGLQTALRLHHSVLDGRKINVELSAGGGGKSDARMKKLKDKNAKLEKARIESSKKRTPEQPEGESRTQSSAKPRHSTTSGAPLELPSQKTWSVPNDGEVAGRGGQRQQRQRRIANGRRGPEKNRRVDTGWKMSGANAIPVG